MKIKYEQRNGTFFYYTFIYGTKVNLSKALVDALKQEGIFAEEIDTDKFSRKSDLILTSQAVQKNGKTYINLYLTLKKEGSTNGEALPF